MKHLTALWLCVAICISAPILAQPAELFFQFNLDNLQNGPDGSIDRKPVTNEMDNGYNTAFSFYDIMLKKTNEQDYFQGTSCYKKDIRSVNPEFKESFDLLKPTTNVLRFPGGELANFYHLGTRDPDGCFTNTVGYGVNDLEIISRKNVNNFTKEKKEEVRTNRNAIFDLIELCKQYPDIEVVYVMNLATHFINWHDSTAVYWMYHYTSFNNWEDMLADPDYQFKMQENLNAIRLLQEHGIKIRAIELGNELYMNDYPVNLSINDSEAEKQEYLVKFNNLVKIYSDSIRQLFPGIPMGVPYSDRNIMYEKQWNRTLRDNSSYFDAYVYHDYFTNKEWYTKHEHCNVKLEERLVDLMDFIGNTGKKIWITEWNLLFGETGNKNDLNNAAYIFDYTTSIYDINARYNNIVEIMTLHNLAAWSESAPLLSARGNYFKHAQPYIKPNASVWGAYMLNLFDVLVSSDEKYAIFDDVHFNAIDSADVKFDRNKLFLKSFWQPNDDIKGVMYFANLTDQAFRLSKENSYVLSSGRNMNFTDLDSAYRNEGVPAYNIFYIDSISNDSIFSDIRIKTDTALIPANAIGIILTSYLADNASPQARLSTPSCKIRNTGFGINELKDNMDDIRRFLCDSNAPVAKQAPVAANMNEGVTVYPNPARTTIWLEKHTAGEDVKIYNQVGIQMLSVSTTEPKISIDIRTWPAGMYHYMVSGKGDIKNGHFVVQ